VDTIIVRPVKDHSGRPDAAGFGIGGKFWASAYAERRQTEKAHIPRMDRESRR
jgi:hypothetical protein